MSPLGNEDARAQVGTNGGLSQRWREEARKLRGKGAVYEGVGIRKCANELDVGKLLMADTIEEIFKVEHTPHSTREAVLKIIREIL